MNVSTDIVLGKMGNLRPRPVLKESVSSIPLPAPEVHGGLPLMDALSLRRSSREFARDALPLPLLSSLLWSAFGVNRADGGRTAPSALNAQEIDVFVALPDGTYLYDAIENTLRLTVPHDMRQVTGYQDFVDEAPVNLVYVANHARMERVPVEQREDYACIAAGAIAQNVYLFAAGNRLTTVLRAWIDRTAIADALGLAHDQQVLLSQTVGFPRTPH